MIFISHKMVSLMCKTCFFINMALDEKLREKNMNCMVKKIAWSNP